MQIKKIIATGLATLMLAACTIPAVSALEPHGTGIKMRNWLTNDPNYQFSEEYKTSVWYQNFTALDFSENQRNTVLRIAISQLGYHEGDSAADFDGMNMSGSSNYIEYARLLIPHYNNNHYEWCACFVNWCLNQAHIDYASSEIGCWKWVGELKTMKMWQDSAAYKGTYTPKPADFIFFNWKHEESKNNASGHIGYVLYTTDTHVYTIEGNADNNVTIRSYALNDPSVIGYGTPPYDEGDEETIDFSYANGRPRGYYVVNSMTARLRDENNKSLGRVPVGSCVELCGIVDGQAKVIYNDKEGYLPENILVLMTPMEGVDTVTFDTNSGQNGPAPMEVPIGDEAILPTDVPTLEGDTFLGWALRPYDMVPSYLPGDKILLSGDVTLYAIWENHSKTLADAAMAEGILVKFPRPSATNNSAALIMGSVNSAVMAPSGSTAITLVSDDTYGQVMSWSSTEANGDPYVTVPYAALMKAAKLPMRKAQDVTYVVLCVKNVSLSNRSVDLFYTCDNSGASDSNDQTARVVSTVMGKDEGWQYVVFDMRDAKDWQGTIQSLRIDYERSALDAGETLLVSGLYLISNDKALDALKDGMYFFPAEENVSYTEGTEDSDIPVVNPGEESTAGATQDTTGESEDDVTTDAETQQQKGGCGSLIAAPALGIWAISLIPLAKRRKEQD